MKEKHSITTQACKGTNIQQAISYTQPEREGENILSYRGAIQQYQVSN
jgi:hypothetical protein